ncbi:MAG: PAS domain S-box protein [Candidatus Acidiferrales bacterium]
MKRKRGGPRPRGRRARTAPVSASPEPLPQKLAALTFHLAKSLDVNRVLEDLLVGCAGAVGSRRGAAYLAEADGQLSLRAQLGYSGEARPRLADFFGQMKWLREVAEAGEPVAMPGVGKSAAPSPKLLSQARAKSLLLVPLTLGKDCLGLLAFASRTGQTGAKASLFTPAVRLQLGQATAMARLIYLSTASERRFRDLVHGLHAIVWEADPVTWQFTFVSRRAEEILGYPVEQWLTEPDFWANHICEEDRKRAVAFCRRATAEGRHHEFEYRAVAADGRLVWLRDTVRVVQDEEGKVQQLRGLMVDITERKQAEKELEERSTYLRALIENSPIAIVVLDAQHRIQMANPAFERLFLYSQGETIGRPLDELIAPPGKTTEAAGYTRQVLAGESVYAVTRRRRKDGSLIDVEVHGVPLLVEGKLIGVYALYRDITERLRAEQLQATVYRIAEAADQAATLDNLYREVHQTIQGVLPADNFYIALYDEREDLLRFAYFVDEVDVAPTPHKPGRGLTEYVLRTGKPLLCTAALHEELTRRGEAEMVGPASPIWLGVPLRIGEKAIGVMAAQHYSDPSAFGERELQVFQYISTQVAKAIERKRVQEASANLAAIVESSDDAVVSQTLEGTILSWNAGAERLYGYSAAEIIGRPASLLEPPEGTHVWPALLTRIRRRERVRHYETERVGKDGRRLHVSLSLAPLQDATGRVVAVSVIGRDITERKQAEEALRRSEAEQRSLVENAPYGIYRATREGKFLTVNPALREMLHYGSKEELLAANAYDIYRDPAERDRLFEAHLSGDRFEGVEVAWKRKDGKPLTVRLGGRVVRDPQGEVAYMEVIAENITERRVLEQALRQAMKMEAVGRLAGGVAHDFNNLLTVIRGHSELLSNRLGEGHALRPSVLEIDKAAQRAAALTQQLLAFSRKQMIQPRLLDLNGVVANTQDMLRRLIGEDIELIAVASPELASVKADPNQLEQVILNLAVNARDAMPKGGKLIIETANAELDEVYASQHPGARPGRYVLLAVSDTGTGMDAETQAHLFEPFFTTKEKGKGTGLGLATVYGVVKQNEGYIWVYSELGRGTTVKIFLPRVEQAVEGEAAKPAAPVAAPRGSETVLLVEDEEPLRRLAREFLESNGYRVLEAPTGQEALRLAERFQGPIHLLLTDVVMPGLSGRELAERLAPRRPETKVLYMSGYTEDAIVHHGVLGPGMSLLQKPFTLDALARKLRQVLGAGPTA